jgi:hypothetical protein
MSGRRDRIVKALPRFLNEGRDKDRSVESGEDAEADGVGQTRPGLLELSADGRQGRFRADFGLVHQNSEIGQVRARAVNLTTEQIYAREKSV